MKRQNLKRPFASGPDNGNWKGGIVVNDGYTYVLQSKHSAAYLRGDRYIMRAIVNWEKANGRPFPEGMEPHHKNFIRSDDRPINIQPLTHAKHMQLHNRLQLDLTEISKLYFEEHLSLRAIGRKYGIDHHTIRRHLNAAA